MQSEDASLLVPILTARAVAGLAIGRESIRKSLWFRPAEAGSVAFLSTDGPSQVRCSGEAPE